MSIDEISEQISGKLSKRYSDIKKAPSLMEIVGLAVQLVEGNSLTSAQKMQAVRMSVVCCIKSLNVTEEEKQQLLVSSSLIEDIAESAVSLIKVNNSLKNCLFKCFNTTIKKFHIPFPILNE